MSSSQYRVRGATLDDVSQLVELWKSMNFNSDDLAKRITEFQVAENGEGKLLGAVGLQILQRQGMIHSEAFTDFALAEALRPLLWERLHSVAVNHGLLRLWTHETAPFWRQSGLQNPEPESADKMPAVWKNPEKAWLTLKLKEDLEEVISADKEFALFMESERQRSRRTLQQAKVLKFLAIIISL